MSKQEPEKLSHKEVMKIRKQAWTAFLEDNQSEKDTDLEFFSPQAVIRDMIEFLKSYDPLS